jgi:NAD(P)-dependent dehydrogenase (short-subunit alcohol dehydrogenase family)
MWREGTSARYKEAAASRPMQRFGRPEEAAAAILFLASEAASWVTGHTLPADGGALLTGL